MATRIDPNAIVQSVNINNKNLSFKNPSSICVSGGSMSGKTEFIIKMITHRSVMFDVEFDQIFYCLPESLSLRHNPASERIKNACPNIQFITGLPDVEKLHLNLDFKPKILFIDDLQEEFLNDSKMLALMTVHCHHFNITVVFTLQNFYAHSKFGRTMFRQIMYRVIFYNKLDLTEIRAISSQIYQPPKFLIESFEFLRKEFPSEPAYLLIDGHVQSPLKELFVRSQIFPKQNGEIKPIFFFPNSK